MFREQASAKARAISATAEANAGRSREHPDAPSLAVGVVDLRRPPASDREDRPELVGSVQNGSVAPAGRDDGERPRQRGLELVERHRIVTSPHDVKQLREALGIRA